MTVETAALVSALQRAFAEAGNPNIRQVATSGIGVGADQISDWRAGRAQPATFRDFEPIIAYLQVAAAGAEKANRGQRHRVVTAWPTERWRSLWEAASRR